MTNNSDSDYIQMATGMAGAWLANTHVRTTSDAAAALIRSLGAELLRLQEPRPSKSAEPRADHPRAVSVRASLANPDRIVSMIDGKPYASLKRHLAANGLTPQEYRTRYRLKDDYPMVAPGYSAQRSDKARQAGLGRKKTEPANAAAVADAGASNDASSRKKVKRKARAKS